MKIILIAPHVVPAVRGNAVTVGRIAGSLSSAGCSVTILSAERQSAASLFDLIDALRPDLLHTFHAYHAGRLARAVSAASGIPYVVTLTGSDIYEALADERREETVKALRGAAAVTAFHGIVAARVAADVPEVADRLRIVPQGVKVVTDRAVGPNGPPILLLPAGLRPVKNVLQAIRALAPLADAGKLFELLLAGPVLDDGYASLVLEEEKSRDFVRYLGAIDHDQMPQYYRRAAVVLNTSLFEGGMPNAVLEGMAAGRPVVASDIEGNRSLVMHGRTGFLYTGDDDFRSAISLLLDNPELRQEMGDAGRGLVLAEYSEQRELEGYLAVYREALRGVRE